jgi:peptide/nickel transport system permease protein
MWRYVTKRVLSAVATLLVVVTVAFFAINMLLPYDFAITLGQREDAAQSIREVLGTDRPLIAQWADYMWGLLHGNLGVSFDDFGYWTAGAPTDGVRGEILTVLPSTLAIFAVGGVVAYLLGEWLGRAVAWNRSRTLRASASSLSVLAFTSFPPWLVFLLTYFFTERLFQVRSVFGLGPVAYGPTPEGPLLGVLAFGLTIALAGGIVLRAWARKNGRRLLAIAALPLGLGALVVALVSLGVWAEAIDNLTLPSAVMATAAIVLIAFGEIMLVMRAGVSAEMTEDYVFTARAKGLPERLIRDRHVAPNAVLPAMSRFITSVPYLITGLIIIERELRLHGVASLFFTAIEDGNIPVIMGILVVVGIIGLVLRVCLDVAQAVMDPRLRIQGGTR